MDIKEEKVKKICYKKALVNGMNYDSIVNELYDIMNECDEISYYDNVEFEELADILGDDELAYEFKMMFGTLSADCDRLSNDLQDYDIPQYFDDFFVAVRGGSFNGLGYYDEENGDYYGLDIFESELAVSERQKRIERLTKSEIIYTATKCFRIFMSFVGVKNRYQDLKTAIDILKDKHSGLLQAIKEINELYEKSSEENFWGEYTKKFDKVLNSLPYDIWVQ